MTAELGTRLKIAPPSDEEGALARGAPPPFELAEEPDRSRFPVETPGTSSEALEAALCRILLPFDSFGAVPSPFDPASGLTLKLELARLILLSFPISLRDAPPLCSLLFMMSSNHPAIFS